MRFCDTCNNMFYVKVDENTDLVYYCKFCNNSITESKEKGSVLVIDDNKVDDNIILKPKKTMGRRRRGVRRSSSAL